MPSHAFSVVKCETGLVLFFGIVGYSKLLIEERKKRGGQLAEIVLAPSQVAKSINEQLVRLATGDGMALVSRNGSEELVNYERETCRALQR